MHLKHWITPTLIFQTFLPHNPFPSKKGDASIYYEVMQLTQTLPSLEFVGGEAQQLLACKAKASLT